MGDRSNIVVVQPDESRIWLYGHWMGEDSIRIVRDVLSRKERWGDSPYLARMFFSQMVAGDLDSDTGYGISTTMCDNEYPIIVVNPSDQTVHLEEYIWGELPDGSTERFSIITPTVTFEMFINAASVSESFNDLAVSMGSRLVAA